MASPRPRPPWLRVVDGVGLPEAVEHERQELAADALTGVGDRELHVVADVAQRDRHRAAAVA